MLDCSHLWLYESQRAALARFAEPARLAAVEARALRRARRARRWGARRTLRQASPGALPRARRA
jgi:hypothetical protein